MKNSAPRALLASFVAAAMVVAGTTSASAADGTPSPSHDGEQFAAQLDAALETQPDVYVDTLGIPEGQVVVQDGTVSAPSGGEDAPFSLSIDESSVFGLGAAGTTVGDDFGVVVVDEGDGAFRALFHIPTKDSPRDYQFEVDAAFELIPLEDGGITVRTAAGDLAGTIAPPWAVDSNGVSVPTEYIISGNTVVQRVYPSVSTAYPVVADPFWIPALMVMAHLTRHAITQAAARGVSQALIKQVVQNGVKSAGKKGTSVFTQGKGANKIRVVVDNKTGNVITVTKG